VTAERVQASSEGTHWLRPIGVRRILHRPGRKKRRKEGGQARHVLYRENAILEKKKQNGEKVAGRERKKKKSTRGGRRRDSKGGFYSGHVNRNRITRRGGLKKKNQARSIQKGAIGEAHLLIRKLEF